MRRIFVAAALVAAAIGGNIATAATYRIVVLPLPPGEVTRPQVTGINNVGDAVGYVTQDIESHPVVWEAASGYVPRSLPMGTATSATAAGINDAGDIVGQFLNPPRAVLWRGNDFTLLGTPQGSHSDASEIAAGGTIRGNTAHPFAGTWDTLWTTPSTPTELRYDYLAGPFDSVFIRAMNDAGVLVGSASTRADGLIHAIRRVPGKRIEILEDLVPPSGEWMFYDALDVNNAGQAVGEVIWSRPTRALLWDRSGSVRDLGALPGRPGFYASYSAQLINDVGVVTGTYNYGGGYQAFVWTAATGMRSIVDLIERSDPVYPLVAAGTPITIRAINRNGAMAAMLGESGDPQVPILLLPQAGAIPRTARGAPGAAR